jgi:hypothetical protein
MADNEKPENVEKLATWRKKIEMIGIDIKSRQRKRNKTTHVKDNTHESAFHK